MKNAPSIQTKSVFVNSNDTSATMQRNQILILPDNKGTKNTEPTATTGNVHFDSVKPQLNDQIDDKKVNPIQRAKLNPNSLRSAVNAQCYECINDKSDTGTWRQQVEACPSKNCPLYCHRPKTISKGDSV